MTCKGNKVIKQRGVAESDDTKGNVMRYRADYKKCKTEVKPIDFFCFGGVQKKRRFNKMLHDQDTEQK